MLIKTFGDPGNQGAGVTGMQGAGVKTPKAAAVAAITIGFAGELHIPKGGILAIGAKSIIVAARGPDAMTGGPFGITFKTLGAAPKLHLIAAPAQTS